MSAPSETAFCKLHGKQESGEVIVKFVRAYPVKLGRTKEQEGEYGHIQIGSSKSISRVHAEIDWNGENKCFEIKCLGKNGITVDQMLYKPDNIPAKLKQNSAIKIGGSRFYFLLPKQKPKMPVIDMLTEAARKLIEEDKSLKEKGFTVKELAKYVTTRYDYYNTKEQKSSFERTARNLLDKHAKSNGDKFSKKDSNTEGGGRKVIRFVYKMPGDTTTNSSGKKRAASEISKS